MNLDQVQRENASASGAVCDTSTFFSDGFLGPVPILSAGQRELVINHLSFGKTPPPHQWHKARATRDRLLYDIATCPKLLAMLRPLLGENIILWGVTFVQREPGQIHPWHVDMESAARDQRFATVWIGLRNTSRESGLNFITRSHTFPKTVQEVLHAREVDRWDATDETVLDWAREFDPQAEIVKPDITDGEALFFDGRIWHGSRNRHESATRLAMLLQYASTDSPVFRPAAFDTWPLKFQKFVRPPVIVVSGEGNDGGNLQVPPPPTSPDEATWITTEARPLALPLAEDPETGWCPHRLFKGLTDAHDLITCHASVLSPGRMPHPPHSHAEEEILIVLDGEAELLIGESPDVERAQVHPVRPGTFAYYPAYQHHTLRNAGAGPLTYLMLKWRGTPMEAETVLDTRIVDPTDHPPKASGKKPKPFRSSLLLEGPTNFLSKLHVHYSEVEPGAGYEPHGDEYDVAIVVLSGMIETIGQRVEPFGVVYYAANEPHGLRAKGPEPARYLVFEFHDDSLKREKTRGTIRDSSLRYRMVQKVLNRYPGIREIVPEPVKDLARYILH